MTDRHVDRTRLHRARSARIADEIAAAQRRRRRPQRALPRRDDRRAARGRALSAFAPRSSAGRRLLRGARPGLLRARPPLRRQRHGLRDAPDPGRRRSSATSTSRVPGSRTYLRRDLRRAAAGRLGHLRDGHGRRHGRSVAARRAAAAGQLRFDKQAPTVSYGAYADDLAHHRAPRRRGRAVRPGRSCSRAPIRHELEPQGTWDPLGMRGTCSPGYVVRAEIDAEADPARPASPTIAAESMVPVSHILWSHLWLGIATDAFDRARAFVAASREAQPGETPRRRSSPALPRDERARPAARAEVRQALRSTCDRRRARSASGSRPWPRLLRFNNLKIAASEQAPRVCQGAIGRDCGIVGFKNDTPFSVGRHLRDTMSAALMVANERIHSDQRRACC